MENQIEKLFITVLGDTSIYTLPVKMEMVTNDNQILNMEPHWYASYSLLTFLMNNEQWIPDKIIVLYPNTKEGIKSCLKGW